MWIFSGDLKRLFNKKLSCKRNCKSDCKGNVVVRVLMQKRLAVSTAFCSDDTDEPDWTPDQSVWYYQWSEIAGLEANKMLEYSWVLCVPDKVQTLLVHWFSESNSHNKPVINRQQSTVRRSKKIWLHSIWLSFWTRSLTDDFLKGRLGYTSLPHSVVDNFSLTYLYFGLTARIPFSNTLFSNTLFGVKLE